MTCRAGPPTFSRAMTRTTFRVSERGGGALLNSLSRERRGRRVRRAEAARPGDERERQPQLVGPERTAGHEVGPQLSEWTRVETQTLDIRARDIIGHPLAERPAKPVADRGAEAH